MTSPWWTCADQYADDPEAYYAARAALFAHNRRLDTTREDWPDGFLLLCERIEAEHPGWAVTWLPALPMPGRERPPRWAAMIPEEAARYVSGLGWRRPWVFGATVADLLDRIAEMDGEIEAAKAQEEGLWTSVRRGVC